ncbi:MAG: hypothetical protein AAF645_21940, partial [Myxococcota bacterium]
LDAAIACTAPFLEAEAFDPYERATTQLTHASLLEAKGSTSEAEALRKGADAELTRLGADLPLERRRWEFDA